MQALELAVPGTYLAGEPVVTIAGFAAQLTVITSKQRPRKLTIHGSDGAEYQFLLKVHPAFLLTAPLRAVSHLCVSNPSCMCMTRISMSEDPGRMFWPLRICGAVTWQEYL